MISEIILFVLGFVFLIAGSDFFVKSSASIARRLGVSEFIIGLTVVAFGTSLPELASSVAASFFKDSGLIIGNVIGSNIANIGLVVGIAAAIYVIRTKREMLRRDGLVMLFATALLFVFIFNGTFSRIEAVFFLLLYAAYMIFLFEEEKENHFGTFLKYFFKFQYLATLRSRVFYVDHKKKLKQKGKVKKMVEIALLKDFLILIVSSIAIFFGAKYLIKEAVYFANMLNVPSDIIGITLIALGTSLPELMVTLTAARKGYGDIALGNIIGSNITNIFLIVGISGLIFPLSIIKSTIYFALPFMILISLVFFVFLRTSWRVKRTEGIIFLILYLVFMVFLVTGLIY